jgi:hypothetical protein
MLVYCKSHSPVHHNFTALMTQLFDKRKKTLLFLCVDGRFDGELGWRRGQVDHSFAIQRCTPRDRIISRNMANSTSRFRGVRVADVCVDSGGQFDSPYLV